MSLLKVQKTSGGAVKGDMNGKRRSISEVSVVRTAPTAPAGGCRLSTALPLSVPIWLSNGIQRKTPLSPLGRFPLPAGKRFGGAVRRGMSGRPVCPTAKRGEDVLSAQSASARASHWMPHRRLSQPNGILHAILCPPAPTWRTPIKRFGGAVKRDMSGRLLRTPG